MRTFIRIFLNLLMPISLIMTLGSVVFFSFTYDFSKALKLGILSGVLIGFSLSFIGTIVLLVMRLGKPPVQQTETVNENTHVNTTPTPSEGKTSIEQTLMLLMDKQLAFDVALFSIEDQNIGDIKTKESKEKCTITVQNEDETIQLMVTPLTRHTAQIVLNTKTNSGSLQKIISYIKEKEHSFLQY